MDLRLKLVMQSDTRVLGIARAAVSEFAAVCGLSEDERQGVVLALDEALANIIRHAYKHRHDQEMELSCQANQDRIVFRMLDQGEPADPEKICGRPLDEVSLSGRGTHLMKAIMDEVAYELVPEGNQLTLVKYLGIAAKNSDGSTPAPHGG